MAVYGLPALHFLRTKDPIEQTILWALAQRADRFRDLLDRRLAIHIANAFARSQRG